MTSKKRSLHERAKTGTLKSSMAHRAGISRVGGAVFFDNPDSQERYGTSTVTLSNNRDIVTKRFLRGSH
ncbi:hypothetical protein AB1N83_003397 [Pleurotus pulmonarius]